MTTAHTVPNASACRVSMFTARYQAWKRSTSTVAVSVRMSSACELADSHCGTRNTAAAMPAAASRPTSRSRERTAPSSGRAGRHTRPAIHQAKTISSVAGTADGCSCPRPMSTSAAPKMRTGACGTEVSTAKAMPVIARPSR